MEIRMLHRKTAIAVLCTLAIVVMPCDAAENGVATEKNIFADAARVVFLGDSITYAGGYIDAIETWLLTRFPDRSVEIINLGLPSEMVSGLTEPDHPFPRPDVHERLDRALAKTTPDVVIACYGMNDGIYHPYSDERAAAYHAGLDRLIAEVDAAGAKLILMTPPPFEPVSAGDSLVDAMAPEFGYKTPYRGYDDVITRYARWLLDERREAVSGVIDLHGPLTEHLTAARRADPDFTMTGDGVHPNPTGHWLIARCVVASFDEDDAADHTAAQWRDTDGDGDIDVRWNCRVPGPASPGAEVVSLGNCNLLECGDHHVLRVSDTPAGSYRVFEGDTSLGTFTDVQLREGIDVRQINVASINQAASELAGLVTARQRLMRDAWLTHVGHLRPGIPKGLPLDLARAESEKLTVQIDVREES
jgi:lysophospholipase L1-like esterase